MRNTSSTTVRGAGKGAARNTEAGASAQGSAKHPPPPDVVSALYAEHRYAARLLDLLAAQTAAISHGRPFDRDASRAAMTYMTQHLDGYHHPREDAMFVRLEKRDPHLAKRIAEIERAHRTIGSAGKQLLAALEALGPDSRAEGAGVASRIGEYVDAMREHMTIEERDLFPRARQLLDERDLAEVDRAYRRVVDPIFEASVADAYAAYPPVVRYLAEQPALQQAVGAIDRFYESALTLGEALFGATPGERPGTDKPAPPEAARKARR